MIALIKYVFFTVLILFILGIASGIYEGNELDYKGISINATNNSINRGVYLIVDGTLTISYELANIIGKYAIENNWDLTTFLNYIPMVFWGIVLLFIFSSLVKIVIYGYVLIGEFKSQKRDKIEMEKLRNANRY